MFALSFPCLFPYSEGDITSGSRDRLVKLDEGIEHYMILGRVMTGELIFPFAKHRSFMFIALDLIERRRLSSQTKVFPRKNEDIRNLSVAEVLALLSNSGTHRGLIGRISAYAGNIRGCAPYWNIVTRKIKNICENYKIPTIFYTFSDPILIIQIYLILYTKILRLKYLLKFLLNQKEFLVH